MIGRAEVDKTADCMVYTDWMACCLRPCCATIAVSDLDRGKVKLMGQLVD